MATPSWLTGLYESQPSTTAPASLTVLAPKQTPIPSSPPPTPPDLGERQRTRSVF